MRGLIMTHQLLLQISSGFVFIKRFQKILATFAYCVFPKSQQKSFLRTKINVLHVATLKKMSPIYGFILWENGRIEFEMLSSSSKNSEFKARYFCLFKYFRWILSRFHGDKPTPHPPNIYLFQVNIFHTFLWCFNCWLWTHKRLLEISFIIFKSIILPIFYRKKFLNISSQKEICEGDSIFAEAAQPYNSSLKKLLLKIFQNIFAWGICL